MNPKFERWIRALEEDVIQDEYGYEPEEFTVYPSMWRGLFNEGLTPQQAFRRALDAHAEARREEERQRLENWERIQAADKALATPPSAGDGNG